MKAFAALFSALDGTTKTGEKVSVLADYFRTAPEPDRLWTIALLSGRRPKRSVSATELREWAAGCANLPNWLFDDAYSVVGDLAETIALILPVAGSGSDVSLSHTILHLMQLAGQSVEIRRDAVLADWQALGPLERFLYNKLLTGGFRMGVSQGLMTRALAQATGVDEATLAHRLMGNWTPQTVSFADLLADHGDSAARPYPFALAAGLDGNIDTLGDPSDWQAEWKWDGIRGQLVARAGAFALWSRGGELITDRFPEFTPFVDFLPPGTVIDGEVLAWDRALDRPLPFAALQTRIGRKTVSKALLASVPARMLAFDLLEDGGVDLRSAPLTERRARLLTLIAALPANMALELSPTLPMADWTDLTRSRAVARDRGAEGVMLKRGASAYHVGRKRGDWWKWKLDPYSVDAVMIYAQAGHGRRANLFTDFTFAVRNGNELVPFTKAYSGLTDAEFADITRWVHKNTLERFGPVRRVTPELVFEIAFEGMQASPRHKSGIALRFPRMVRWRHDKGVGEIDSLDALKSLLSSQMGAPPPNPRDT